MDDTLCVPLFVPHVCMPDFSNAYISDKNEDNATKLSGYDPWGLQGTSRMSWMTHFGICDMTCDV